MNSRIRTRLGAFRFTPTYKVAWIPATHFLSLLSIALWLFPFDAIWAHERWILTPEQIQVWSEKPTPTLWSTLTFLNGSMILGFVMFTIGWIRLGFTGARELFPDLQARLGEERS